MSVKPHLKLKLAAALCLTALSAPSFAQTLAVSSSANCLRMSDVLQLSADRSPSVLISRGFEAEADTQITQARSLFQPRVSAFGRSGAGDTGIVDSGVSNQAGLRASQRIFDLATPNMRAVLREVILKPASKIPNKRVCRRPVIRVIHFYRC